MSAPGGSGPGGVWSGGVSGPGGLGLRSGGLGLRSGGGVSPWGVAAPRGGGYPSMH